MTGSKDMLGRGGLLTVRQTWDILAGHLAGRTTATETLPLVEAFDRVLATEVLAPSDLPAEARSTMDGFAVSARDTFGASQGSPCYLTISGEVRMGEPAHQVLTPGSCQKIPTGGLLPQGADGVVMLEDTIPVDATMIEIVKGTGVGGNVIARGEDIAAGALALAAGTRLRPQDIGLLAGLGIAEVEVYRQVRVGILSTGDEIVPHHATPEPGQIRDINALALAGQVLRCGGVHRLYPIVSDREEIFLPALRQAVTENDVVLFSGGSSVGVRDLGEQVITALGPPGILVHGVALKPGKPVLIGMSGGTPIFGLPGHPVSAMVCFDLFVAPTMEILSGLSGECRPRPYLLATLARNLNSAAGRRDIVRVRLQQNGEHWLADPVLGKSGSISTLSRAHGYFEIEESIQGVNENSTVKVFLYP